MANGTEGTGVLDLVRRLRPEEWMQLVGASLGTLGVGRPGQRIYPFGPLAVLGAGLGAQRARRESRQAWEAGAQSMTPEFRQQIGPLVDQLSPETIIALMREGTQKQQQRAATRYWPQVYGAPSAQSLELEPPTAPEALEGGWIPGRSIMVQPPATEADYLRNLAQVPEQFRSYLPPPRGRPAVDPTATEARARYQSYRQFLSPEEAATAVQTDISGARGGGVGMEAAMLGRQRAAVASRLPSLRLKIESDDTLSPTEKDMLLGHLSVVAESATPVSDYRQIEVEFNQVRANRIRALAEERREREAQAREATSERRHREMMERLRLTGESRAGVGTRQRLKDLLTDVRGEIKELESELISGTLTSAEQAATRAKLAAAKGRHQRLQEEYERLSATGRSESPRRGGPSPGGRTKTPQEEAEEFLGSFR